MRTLFLIFLLPLFARAALSATAYNAASAICSDGAVLQDCASCSGKKNIGYIGGDGNGTAVFSNVSVRSDGLYEMTVRFIVSDDRSFEITVNHAPIPQTVIFRRQAGKDEVSSQTILVPLRAGANVVSFGNTREYGPDLVGISVGSRPVRTHSISGTVRARGGVEVALSGAMEQKAITDAKGRYEFKFLPEGEYRVTPQSGGQTFSPMDRIFSVSAAGKKKADFSARIFPAMLPSPTMLESGHWKILYDMANGVADVLFDGAVVLAEIHAAAHLPETVTSLGYARRALTQRNFSDGIEYRLESSNTDSDKMVQSFRFYDGADYFLTWVTVIRDRDISCNYIAPVVSRTPVALLPPGDNRALFVPFDNDKWVRYNSIPFGQNVTSYEVGAFFNNDSRQAFVIGSIDHDTWKTAVQSSTVENRLTALSVFGGVTSAATRDVLSHGKVTGKVIQSPRIFVCRCADWRDGLDAYARANAVVAPPRPWSGGVPFGWNSWGKLQMNVTPAKAMEVSDFFAANLQPRHFENNNILYIGLDAGWTKFTDAELKQFVDRCHANQQEAGIYFTPFGDFQRHADEKVDGGNYRYRDIYLRANGAPQRIAGGIALDPTHPGTRLRIENMIRRFQRLGFKYVKADFLVHGALEGDHFHDPAITTGLQAYNSGLEFLNKIMGPDMYLNLAISPLFPSQYANSRRIACDAWGDIGKVEYTLNAVTYGGWLGFVYDYNDPDHVVLGGYAEGENRARVTSAAITGLFLSGDDLSEGADAAGKEKAGQYLTNPDIDSLARARKSFRPVEGNTGNRASNLFVYENETNFFLAAFNFSQNATNFFVAADRIGLVSAGPYPAKELWSGVETNLAFPLKISIPPADVMVYKFVKKL